MLSLWPEAGLEDSRETEAGSVARAVDRGANRINLLVLSLPPKSPRMTLAPSPTW